MVSHLQYRSLFLRCLALLFPLIQPANTWHSHPFCHETESSALLHFKDSFAINNSPTALHSWNQKSDCCLWDGVECDESSGHVVGLNLSSCSLFGSINSTTKIFNLVHLRSLDLSNNDFNLSSIPPELGCLSSLTHLNLSYSRLSGLIPPSVSQLSKLTFLDLSENDMLILHKSTLGSLVQNLSSSLEMLHLNWVNMSSVSPRVLSNLTSLRSLILDDCGLHGEFPSDMFKLPNLQHLSVMYNPDLVGYLPDFQWSSPLQTLLLVETGFSGEFPSSIGNLASLVNLDIWACRFKGSVPSSLLNLTRIISLGLGNNSFSGHFPSFLSNLTNLQILSLGLNTFSDTADLSWANGLTKLTVLHLPNSNIHGKIPSSFGNLTQLTALSMGYNQLTGEIPLELLNLTRLTFLCLGINHLGGTIPSPIRKWSELAYLDLSFNNLHGLIPSDVFELQSLVQLDLSFNNLSGKVELHMFLDLENLSILHLSGNRLSVHDRGVRDGENIRRYPKLKQLGLSSCNLTKFPDFIANQHQLEWLELAWNNIHGSIPTWILNTSTQTLLILNLSSNFLTGFDHLQVVPMWTRLIILDLSHNYLKSSLPNPPPTTLFYSASNNSFTGIISPLLCKMGSLQALDLSQNNLTGRIPQCLSNFSPSLSVLNLRSNNLEGPLPETWRSKNRLKMINFSENKLKGKLPRSLAKCEMLESIDIGDNKINDTFPDWLGSLPELKVLLLRSNSFHGTVTTNLQSDSTFCKLQVIDLSYNCFTGKLPSQFFLNWNPLKKVDQSHLTYLQIYIVYYLPGNDVIGTIWDLHYVFSLTMVNKGSVMYYEKIQELLTAVDFSSNHFHGEVPESIGHMKELYLLNLSNNFLSGHIPESFENLTRLESLDLSQNKLSGQIPQQLAQLTFLEMLNVSCNNLAGPIPHGQQFNTFQSNSFDGNPGLCGNPLPNRCADLGGLPPLPLAVQEDEDSKCLICFDWKVVLIGYACGCIVGAVIGNTTFKRLSDWSFRALRCWKH